MESKEDMIAVIKIIGIATSIGKAGIDFDEGQKQCKEVMKKFEAQIRQNQKEKCLRGLGSIAHYFDDTGIQYDFVRNTIMEADQ